MHLASGRYGRRMGIGRGDEAPGFTLPGIDPDGRRDFSLADHRGRPVVLVFYPGDNTPVCTQQLTTYTEDIERFADVGAQVLAISPQSVDSHAEFSCQNGGFAFPLLADEDRAVGGGLRDHRAARLLPAVGVRGRRRRHRGLRPPCGRGAHLQAHRRADRGGHDPHLRPALR